MKTETEMETGKVYDVVSLFSGKQRDFLVKNNGEKVKVESLKGKTVAIYFLSLNVAESSELDYGGYRYTYRFFSGYTRSIKVVYDDLSPRNNFQVVFVADVYDGDDGDDEDESEDKELFDALFSGMPWLAIPQDDKESRRKLFSMIDANTVCTILDGNGKIVNLDAITDFNVFGPECYPFTPERINQIYNDDMSAQFSMSLKRLLTTPTRDFLIRSNSKRVPVSDLEGKVVAFYFYIHCESGTVDELIDLYEKLREMGKQFEIVFINSRSRPNEDEKSFMKAFKRTPWLGLPSNDTRDLKLRRILGCPSGQLVIVSPGAKFPDTHGLAVITHCGIEAYPFTRQRVTEMEVERLKSLNLESILFSGRCKYIEGNDKQKITAHQLVNKTILLLFTRRSCEDCRRLVPRLIKWYNETKERRVKEDFEIIHFPYNYSPAKKCYYGTMPWLQFPYDAKYNKNMFEKTLNLRRGMPAIVAFGADGKILTRNAHLKFLSESKIEYRFTCTDVNFFSEEWESKIEYPFAVTDVDFFSEVERDVAFEMGWPVQSDEYANMQRRNWRR